MLQELHLIVRKENTLMVEPECHIFALNSERRREMAKEAFLKWPIFKTFVEILREYSTRLLTQKQLGSILVERCGVDWNAGTAETNVKIMLDWARHLGLASGVHASSQRGRFRPTSDGAQIPLFNQTRSTR